MVRKLTGSAALALIPLTALIVLVSCAGETGVPKTRGPGRVAITRDQLDSHRSPTAGWTS